MPPRSLLLLFSIVALQSCASAVVLDAAGEGGSDAMASDVTTNDATLSDAGNGPCPTAEPTTGQPCGIDGTVCTYGSDPLFTCRDRATCGGGRWTVLAVDCTGAGMCSATPPSGACTPNNVVCPYPDGTRCICTACPGGPCTMNPSWFCSPPPADTRCPRISPQLGQTCSVDSLECDYGACSQGWKLRCTGGVWVMEAVPCPR